MTDMTNLPKFVDDNPNTIANGILEDYAAISGKVTAPAQSDRMLLDVIANAKTLAMNAINDTGRQNLVRFARAPMLDYLGDLVGVTRLPAEDDEALRARILLAPAQFSTAGSVDAYKYLAKTADASIIDVGIISPSAGVVAIYPLVTGVDEPEQPISAANPSKPRLPSDDLRNRVLAACSADNVRPLTDNVQVLPPVARNWQLNAAITPNGTVALASLQSGLAQIARNFADNLSAGLGRDVVQSQIIAALSVAGVYQVTLTQPDSAIISVAAHEWAKCNAINLTYNPAFMG